MRHLTLASRARQQEWLTLWRDPESRAPTGSNLKHWLCGGQSIPTKFALFSLDTFPGEIVTDLFGEDRYFADSDLFWDHQTHAVRELAAGYESEGWQQVHVLPPGERFERWQCERASQSEGGEIYIAVAHSGEVEVHEGWKPRKAERHGKEAGDAKPQPRPELSAPLRNYIGLHRHAAVRAKLIDRPDLTFRLIVAHLICGSGLWRVDADPLHTRKPEIRDSVENAPASLALREAQGEARKLLGFEAAETIIGSGQYRQMQDALELLLTLSDDDVLKIATVAMAESVEAGGVFVDHLGSYLEIDLRGQ